MVPLAIVLLAVAAPVVAQGGWVLRQPAHSPPARAWHSLAFDPQRSVHVLFGGADFLTLHGDTWQWDGLDWQQLAPLNTPSARSRHAMACDFNRNCIVLFGGWLANGTVAGDTWEFDGTDWVQRFPAQSPAPRKVPGMAHSFARGRVILFGGASSSSFQPFQDCWEWDGTSWGLLATVHVPPARYSLGMASDFIRGHVFLSGGWAGPSIVLSDAWSFDGVDWTQLPGTQVPLPVRSDTSITADLMRGMLVQFGGVLVSGVGLNETWLHDGSDWRRDGRPTAITPRRAFALTYDWQRDRAVMFGGFNGNYLSETWEYDLTGAALWSVAGAGCAGTQGVPQLQPAGPQRAIVGTRHVLAVSGGVTGGALFGLGLSNMNWNGNPLPLSLDGFGMPGCALHTSLDVVYFAGAVGGTAQLVLAMPNDPSLVGVQFFAQALVPQQGVNAFGAVMSNAVAEVVGAF